MRSRQSLFDEHLLRDVLARQDLDKTNKLLACLAVKVDEAKTVAALKELATTHGLRGVKNWNVSSYLSRSKGRASRVSAGWILTRSGRMHVASLGVFGGAVVTQISSSLRNHAQRLTNGDTKAFVNEAIACFEGHHYRAAVVLTWVGAMSLLQDHVFANLLDAFNAEAFRRNPKHRKILVKDDFSRLQESDFLDYLEGASGIGKSIKKELVACLDFRNGCGHPNALKLAEQRVAAHIESLMLNVYSRF